MTRVPDPDDKRYFYDGAAYADAYGPRETIEEQRARKAANRARRKAKRAARKARRLPSDLVVEDEVAPFGLAEFDRVSRLLPDARLPHIGTDA